MTDVFITIETNYTNEHGRAFETTKSYKVFAPAIEVALLEYLKKYGFLSNNETLDNFYIELDRTHNVMVAVLEHKTDSRSKIAIASA